jgi:hypothetical protein
MYVLAAWFVAAIALIGLERRSEWIRHKSGSFS